jgi:hypothetical protein
MSKRLFATVILFTTLACKIAQGQVYNVRALDGSAQKIRVIDDEKSTLVISCLQDTIYIHNLNNIEEATLLNHNFLKIVYAIRAGVGLHEVHTVILCINKNKLIEALHFESLFHEEFQDYRESADSIGGVAVNSTYKVDLTLTGNAAKDYKLTAKVHDAQKSKLSRKENFNLNSIAHLNFDPAENIFYTDQLDIARYFTVSRYFTETGTKFRKKGKLHIKGKFPVVKFGKISYYYIKGCWYERGRGDELVKYSYR